MSLLILIFAALTVLVGGMLFASSPASRKSREACDATRSAITGAR